MASNQYNASSAYYRTGTFGIFLDVMTTDQLQN
jgi:hypothetical protein